MKASRFFGFALLAALVSLAIPSQVLAGGCGSSCGSAKSTSACDSGDKMIRQASLEQAAAPVSADASKKMNVVEAAVAAGSFKTLVAAVQAADLVTVLSGEGPFTVFAPTDEAFAKLPKGTVEALLKDKEKLTQVLTYHVVPGKLMAADVTRSSELQTVQGQKVVVHAKDGVKINDARVVQADVAATNGVIHVIDTVILPPAGI